MAITICDVFCQQCGRKRHRRDQRELKTTNPDERTICTLGCIQNNMMVHPADKDGQEANKIGRPCSPMVNQMFCETCTFLHLFSSRNHIYNQQCQRN